MELAVKSLEKSRLSSIEKRMLQNEISIVSDLHHKNIAKCKGIYESRTHIHIVMERVTGGELYEFLNKKKVFPGNPLVLHCFL